MGDIAEGSTTQGLPIHPEETGIKDPGKYGEETFGIKSCWVEAGTLPLPSSVDEEGKLGKWVLCINEQQGLNNAVHERAHEAWERVRMKVENGEFCYAKRTAEDVVRSSSPLLIFIYTRDCFDLKAVKATADKIKEEVFSDFHIICYFQESTFDWGQHYQCQNLLYKYTIEGQFYQLRPKSSESSLSEENQVAATSSQHESRQRLECRDDLTMENDGSQLLSISSGEQISQAQNLDVVNFLEETMDKIAEKSSSASSKGPETFHSQVSVGSLGDGFQDLVLYSQNPNVAEDQVATCSTPQESSKKDNQLFEVQKKSINIEDRINHVTQAVKCLENDENMRLAEMVSTEGGMNVPDNGENNASKRENFNGLEEGSREKSLSERFDRNASKTLSELRKFTDNLNSVRERVGSKHNSLESYHKKIDEHQRETERRLNEMKERFSKMRENVKELTNKHQVEMLQSSSYDAPNGIGNISYDFTKKRHEHKQKIAEMKQRLDEAMERIKQLNENAKNLGADRFLNQKWDLVEFDE